MSETRRLLIEALIKANGNEAWSTDMADRIARGDLELPRVHTEGAHRLAAKLHAETLAAEATS